VNAKLLFLIFSRYTIFAHSVTGTAEVRLLLFFFSSRSAFNGSPGMREKDNPGNDRHGEGGDGHQRCTVGDDMMAMEVSSAI
jgi:hypothetical protein